MTLVHMHNIQIVHRRWQEIDPSEPDWDSLITVNECQDCGARRHTLRLPEGSGPRSKDLPQEELLPERKKHVASGKWFEEMFGGMKAMLLEGTKYPSIESLVEDLERRYQGQLKPKELPLGQLDIWLSTRTKPIQMKVILACKQGLACNRCDSLFERDQLTLDHINGNRSDARLINLQLLCNPCHEDKNAKGNKPDERDISPFSYYGSSCVHRVSCLR